MDFTETPYAEDFYMELMALIDKYLDMGAEKSTIKDVAYQAVEDMFDCEEYVDGE